jgi:TldD protein
MKTSRRDFIKTTGLAAGVVALPALPSWIKQVDAADAAVAAAVDKNALADIALSIARKLGVTYADIRINRYRNENISTREKQVQNVSRTQNFGFGVRVLFKGTWGFASSRDVSPEEVRRLTQQAVDIARANSVYQRKRVTMAPASKVVANWKSAFEKDPFDVAIDDKIQFLLKLNEQA